LLQDDWRTPETAKLELLASVQPNPSYLSKNNGDQKVCLTRGNYANPACDKSRRRP
jgi:hypothetical protein